MNQDTQEQENSSNQKDWSLVCLPVTGQDPVPVTLGELRLIENIGEKLRLPVTRDDKRRKIYLSTEVHHGMTLGTETFDKPTQNQDGVKYLSGWTAEIIPDEEAGENYECVDEETAAPLISAFPDHQVSKNFRLSEFRPGEHAYDLIRLCPRLVNVLEEIRARAGGQTLEVISGYRPPVYNRKLGSLSNSTHVDGIAADITSEYVSVSELYDICDRIIGERGGVGYYPTQGFVHVDLRGYGARW